MSPKKVAKHLDKHGRKYKRPTRTRKRIFCVRNTSEETQPDDVSMEAPQVLNPTNRASLIEETQPDNVLMETPLVVNLAERASLIEGTDGSQLRDGGVLSTDRTSPIPTEMDLSSTFEPDSHSTPNAAPSLPGRRIIHLSSFLDQIKRLNNHPGPFSCNFSDMALASEKKVGLHSTIVMKCVLCGFKGMLTTDGGPKMDLNTSSVVGAIAVGVGHSQTEELLATLDVPFMSGKFYRKIEGKVTAGVHHIATKLMQEAAEREADLARQLGEVDEDGTPLITVVADGSWAKRSYKTKYDSLSGTAAIVGARTGQVLFLGIKNKFCTICCRAELKNLTPKEHTCYRNWSGASTSMESAIILEGFRSSFSMYGVKYNRIIGGGYSSVYYNLVRNRPYGDPPIEKVECTNHLLRNYARKLRTVAENKQAGPSNLRKILASKVVPLGGAAKAASIHWNKSTESMDDNVMNLYADILNSPRHVLGDHQHCASYFCTGPKEAEQNMVPEFQSKGLWDLVMEVVDSLARQSKSLILRCTSNEVEGFNNIIAKLIGGKRVNFCARGSYTARCMGAVVSHNSRAPLSTIHRHMAKKSPGVCIKKLERQRSRKGAARSAKPVQSKRRLFASGTSTTTVDKDYGPLAATPDMTPKEFENARLRFLSRIQLAPHERGSLERETLEQSTCTRWREERRKRLTASKFGQICKRRVTTPCQNIVKELLYKPPITTKAMSYGRFHEKSAIKCFENKLKVVVRTCGLFVHPSIPYLAASPDGLVGEDAVVEIQGQLQVTGRDKCYFIVFTKGVPYILVYVIEKDDRFWLDKMFPKLESFYYNILLPGLVDPRFTRSLPIRDPNRSVNDCETVGE